MRGAEVHTVGDGDQAFDLRLRKTYFMGKLTHEWREAGGEQLAVGWLSVVPGTDI